MLGAMLGTDAGEKLTEQSVFEELASTEEEDLQVKNAGDLC